MDIEYCGCLGSLKQWDAGIYRCITCGKRVRRLHAWDREEKEADK